MLNAPKATVVRDGKRSLIDAEELVVDDIVIFKAGAQGCADAQVCAGEVQVNESLHWKQKKCRMVSSQR